ncbi:hypothetical protein EZS27_016883 [termite gut metagenome]|uniref:Uncharacterized protein n=1 Tax=termite gut metagenome TaxID=433724 RepID=A0A5J4RPM5_9ZZZZ
MKNLVVLYIINVLKNTKLSDENATITLKTGNIKVADDINFFEIYNLYYDLLVEGYEIISMEKDSITVKKTT